MKKIIILFSALFLFGFTPSAFAQQSCNSLQACPSGQTCSNISGGTCVNSSLTNQATGNTSPSAATAPTSGSGFTALAPIPGLTDQGATSVINATSLANFFNNLYKYLIGVAAILAVIMIIWGGLEISTKDSVSQHSEGRERIQQAIFGLVLVLAPVLVFSIINPSILNLSLDLPPISLNTPPSAGGAGAPPTAPTTGCSAPSGGSYLQTYACASYADAQSNITCQNGLTPQLPACKIFDQGTGACLDKPYYAYCAGKTTTVVFYAYTTFKGLKLNLNTGVPVPRDAGVANTFTSSCQNNGGVEASTLTSGANFAVQGISGLLLAPFYTGCSSDYGSIPVNTGQYSGAQCFSVVLSCNPPN